MELALVVDFILADLEVPSYNSYLGGNPSAPLISGLGQTGNPSVNYLGRAQSV